MSRQWRLRERCSAGAQKQEDCNEAKDLKSLVLAIVCVVIAGKGHSMVGLEVDI